MMYKQYHFQENKSFPIFSKINPQSISKNIKFAIRKAELEFTKIISISEEEDKITYNNILEIKKVNSFIKVFSQFINN